MEARGPLQLTLAILKPHVIKNPFVLQKIREIILKNDFKVVKTQRKTLTPEEANLFYQDHREKFFFNRLVTFMCSGPSDIHILTRFNAVAKWRELMGPTKVFQAQYSAPETIRGRYGLSDTRNATHGSDAPESAAREIQIFFKDFDPTKWHEEEESYFRLGQIQLNTEEFVHKIKKNLKIS